MSPPTELMGAGIDPDLGHAEAQHNLPVRAPGSRGVCQPLHSIWRISLPEGDGCVVVLFLLQGGRFLLASWLRLTSLETNFRVPILLFHENFGTALYVDKIRIRIL